LVAKNLCALCPLHALCGQKKP